MNNEKALDILKRLRMALINDRVDGDRVFEPLRIGIAALEKQTPKRVGDTQGDYEYDYDCSTCGEVTRFEHQKYCIECGQRLKW